MENDTVALTGVETAQTSAVPSERGTNQNASRNPTRATVPASAGPTLGTDAFITLIRRAPALAALREQPLDRRDLEDRLGVSKPTVHRLTGTLRENGLVEKSGGVFVLTGLGEAVADTVAEFTRTVETAYRLAPFLEARGHCPALDVSAFTDATVTTAGPGDPYRPVRRYYSLVERTEALKKFDISIVPPEYIDAVHRQVHHGRKTEIIYQPDVVARLLSTHPELLESGRLVLRVHDTLPYGLALFDDRVGIGSYCETTGVLRTFIDTDAPAAREWAESIYESYRAESEPFEPLDLRCV